MLKPARTSHEAERLKALLEYEVLDSEDESSYDEVVRLASLICGTPIAMVSLVDERRQWFKARIGLDATEIDRDISFCGHAIHGNTIFEVQDASRDVRFADNPLVIGGPKVKFYAGAPLVTPTGYSIGTLCVVNQSSQSLSTGQRDGLENLAKIVVRELEARKALKLARANFNALQDATRVVERQRVSLQHFEKMKSLGEMAGDIAHEINTPLAIIQFHAGSLKRRLNSTPESKELAIKAEKIVETVTHIAEITSGMLAFAHDSNISDIGIYPVDRMIKTAVALVENSYTKQGVGLKVEYAPTLHATCSLQKTLQILTNLLTNARDAVKDTTLKEVRIAARPGKKPNRVEIFVEDTGCGVPLELRAKIMDPFFTTKPPGEGTGLGLSISTSLATAQGGSIALEDREKGSCFVVQLPFAQVKA
ncbi:MAG: GAF domain-containing sensor histidine kinase [Chitinophagaceae bacterium]|nr:GAF domain-containing sensor histidine kinase [Oligoflexus sp.]